MENQPNQSDQNKNTQQTDQESMQREQRGTQQSDQSGRQAEQSNQNPAQQSGGQQQLRSDEHQYQTDYGDREKAKMPHGDEVDVNESDTQRNQRDQ